MSDRATVALAVAAVTGALTGWGPSPWVGGALLVAAFASRRPVALVVTVFVCAGGLAARAEVGLVAARPGPFDGWVTALTDAEAGRYDVHADARLGDGRHLQVVASSGSARAALLAASAGERLHIVGRVERPPPGASWLANRHVVGVLHIDEVAARSPGAPWMQAANGLRDLLTNGADALPPRQRPLFLGFVLGDTRGQAVDITDDFRGSGLSHLLAVSGQNVAFVLALAGPFLRRVGLRARLPATLAVIGFFALLTRFEPSVLRASMMAALAVTASSLGREASSARLLALAVTGLVLVDPFLVRSVGFQLSVGACVGIVLLSAPIARSLPGPRALVEALAVSLSAQAGVAPVLIAVFGGIPVAGVPANLLAAPAEGPVMVWGLGAGLVAGVLGGIAAVALHWPTRMLIWWIAAVAHWAAALPFGELQARELALISVGALVAAGAQRVGLRGVRRAGLALIATAAIAPAVSLRGAPPVRADVAAGATLWRAGAAVLELDGRVDAAKLLEALRRAGVTRLDMVIERTTTPAVSDAVSALRRRYTLDRVITPSNLTAPASYSLGGLRVDVRPAGTRLVVEISLAPAASARGPPV